jgi:hypothetical protein
MALARDSGRGRLSAVSQRRYWLSFAEPNTFLGAVCVRAESTVLAHVEVTRLGLNPGGEVRIVEMPPGGPPIPEGVLMSADFLRTNGIATGAK